MWIGGGVRRIKATRRGAISRTNGLIRTGNEPRRRNLTGKYSGISIRDFCRDDWWTRLPRVGLRRMVYGVNWESREGEIKIFFNGF